MQIHELNSRTPTDTDEMALDTGSQTYKTTVGLLKPQFVSYDMANPTSWDDVPLITGNSSIIFVFERLTRAVKNLRYLWKLIGSGDFSNVAETISGAIGNTALGTDATTLSGAIAEHESDISTINGNLTKDYGTFSSVLDAAIGVDSAISAGVPILGLVTVNSRYIVLGFKNSANYATYLMFSYATGTVKLIIKSGGNWTERNITATA